MPGLTIILLAEDAERFRGALMVAMTQRATGGDAQLFLQMDAVRMLVPPLAGPHDDAHRQAGLPALATLLDEALADGVSITACQTGLLLAGLTASDLDPRIETGGLTSFLTGMGPSDLLTII